MDWLLRGFKYLGVLLSLTFLFQSTNLGSQLFYNSNFKSAFLLFSFVDFPFLETKNTSIYQSNLYFGCEDQNGQLTWTPFDYNFSTKLGDLKPIGRYIYYFFSKNQRSIDLINQIKIAKQILCTNSEFSEGLYKLCRPKIFSIRNTTNLGKIENENTFSCP